MTDVEKLSAVLLLVNDLEQHGLDFELRIHHSQDSVLASWGVVMVIADLKRMNLINKVIGAGLSLEGALDDLISQLPDPLVQTIEIVRTDPVPPDEDIPYITEGP